MHNVVALNEVKHALRIIYLTFRDNKLYLTNILGQLK